MVGAVCNRTSLGTPRDLCGYKPHLQEGVFCLVILLICKPKPALHVIGIYVGQRLERDKLVYPQICHAPSADLRLFWLA